MLLIFGNARPNFGEFPNLMTERIEISAGKVFTATSAFGRHAPHNVLALLSGNQCSFVFVVTWLAAALTTRLRFP